MDMGSFAGPAVSIASGIGQWIQSNNANKATAADYQSVVDLYKKIQAPSFDENGVPTPAFDVSKLSPQEYQLLQKYIPQVAQQVKEAAPEVVKQSESMQTGLQAQKDALGQLRQAATTGSTPEFQGALQQAQARAQQEAQSRQQAILESQNRRGLLGGGNMLASQMSGAEGSMQNAAMTGQQAAMDQYRQQLQAVRDSASLGGQIYNQDQGTQQRNADIINAYNARSAQAGQQYENQRANSLNNANMYNIQQAQDLANKNTQNANQYGMYNQQYGNQMAGQSANWQQQQKAYLNNLRQLGYQDQMGITQGIGGATQQRANLYRQQAADTNQAIAAGAGTANTMMMNKKKSGGAGGDYADTGMSPEGEEYAGEDAAGAGSMAAFA